jgi:hypothetical protein
MISWCCVGEGSSSQMSSCVPGDWSGVVRGVEGDEGGEWLSMLGEVMNRREKW